MSHNPYAPPSAAVADIGGDALGERPRPVRIALALFWFALVLALPSAGMALRDELAASSNPSPAFYAFMSTVMTLAFVFGACVIFCIGRARNWARLVYAALTGLGLVSTATSFPEILARPWHSGPLEILITVTNLAAAVLIFLPASNAWFRVRGRQPLKLGD